MKKFLMVAMALIVACSASFAGTDEQKERIKERQAIRKETKEQLNARVSKVVKKEAKRLKKEGWQVKPGALPLEQQLTRAYEMRYQYDDNNFPKYIIGEGASIGSNYDAAKKSALTFAINNIAEMIQTEVTELIEGTLANEQMEAEDAASLAKSIAASKNFISQSIGRTIPVMECYRINSKKNNEVLVQMAYNGDMAREAAKKAIVKNLEEEGVKLHGQLDEILGLK